MSLRNLLDRIPAEDRDAIYMTRERAISLGATHEGTHFGIPHWVWVDERDEDGLIACPKCGLLEPLVTLFCHMQAFVNSLRPPGEELPFSFCIRPINSEVSP